MKSSSRWDQRCKCCLSLFPTQNSRRMTSNLFRFSPVPFLGCLVWIYLRLNHSDKVWDHWRCLDSHFQEIPPVSSAPVFLALIFQLGFLYAFHFQFEQTAVRKKSSSAPTPTPAERPDFKSSRHAKALPFSKILSSVTWLVCCTLFSLGFSVFCYYNSSCVQTAPVCVGGKKALSALCNRWRVQHSEYVAQPVEGERTEPMDWISVAVKPTLKFSQRRVWIA